MDKSLSALEIAQRLHGQPISRNEWKACCPAHDDSSPSLFIKDSDGKVLVHCFAGCTQNAVLQALEDLNLWPENNKTWVPNLPSGIPPVWPPSKVIEKQGLVPGPDTQKYIEKVYRYLGPKKETLGYTCRFAGHGKKDIIPFFKNEAGRWRSGHEVTSGRPLYGLDLLQQAINHPESITVLVCEGEKTADAINAPGIDKSRLVALTWPGGCKSVTKADWSPLNNWWRVVLCPDWDMPGFGAMQEVKKILQNSEIELYLLDASKLTREPTEGWDIADLDPKIWATVNEENILQFCTRIPEVDDLKKKGREIFRPKGTNEREEKNQRTGAEAETESKDSDVSVQVPSRERKSVTGIPQSGGFLHTDVGNGKRFIKRHGGNCLYTGGAGWFLYRGNKWQRDPDNQVLDLAAETAEAIQHDAKGLEPKAQRKIFQFSERSQYSARCDAMLKMARGKLSFDINEFDADPWLINCTNGTLNLKTGELRPHNREDRISKSVEAAYLPTAKAPRWQEFLHRIMEGNSALLGFLQRAIGYSLTGDVSEQVLFLMWGRKGQNGKSVFLETLKKIFGEYCTHADKELVTLDKFNQPSNSNLVARLRGARAVVVNELEEDSVLNESRIKELTGGDTVQARFLYREAFEFRPGFKIWLRTNHRPKIRGTDDAIWRRMLTIPFNAILEDVEKDKHLNLKLLQEADGIFKWAVDGCLEWQRKGLGVPEEVHHENRVYRKDMDSLGDWIDECCQVERNLSVKSGTLYLSYVEWCKESGERASSQKRLALALRERGVLRKKGNQGQRYFIGIALKDYKSQRTGQMALEDAEGGMKI